MALTFLSACKQPTNSSALRRNGNQKIIAGSLLGAGGVATAAVSGMGTLCGYAFGGSAGAVLVVTGLPVVILWPVAVVALPIGIALITIGVTEHKKAKKLAEQERLAALEEITEPRSWHNQPLELEPILPKE